MADRALCTGITALAKLACDADTDSLHLSFEERPRHYVYRSTVFGIHTYTSLKRQEQRRPKKEGESSALNHGKRRCFGCILFAVCRGLQRRHVGLKAKGSKQEKGQSEEAERHRYYGGVTRLY